MFTNFSFLTLKIEMISSNHLMETSTYFPTKIPTPDKVSEPIDDFIEEVRKKS